MDKRKSEILEKIGFMLDEEDEDCSPCLQVSNDLHPQLYFESQSSVKNQNQLDFFCKSPTLQAKCEPDFGSRIHKISNPRPQFGSSAYQCQRKQIPSFGSKKDLQQLNSQQLNSNYKQESKKKKNERILAPKCVSLKRALNCTEAETESRKGLSFKETNMKKLTLIMYSIVEKEGTIEIQCMVRLLKEYVANDKPLTQLSERSVNRRVYDCLNVMVSADILFKNGRIVQIGKEKPRSKLNQNISLTLLNLQSLLQQKQQKVQAKKKQLKQLIEYHQNLKAFFEHKRKQSQSPQRLLINFPFIVLRRNPNPQIQFKWSENREQERVWEKQNSSTCDQYPVSAFEIELEESICDIQLMGDIDFIGEFSDEIGQKSKEKSRARHSESSDEEQGEQLTVNYAKKNSSFQKMTISLLEQLQRRLRRGKKFDI